MLNVRVFVADPGTLGERDAAAIKRVQAAATRFPGQVEFSVLDLDSDDAMGFGASISPTVAVGDMVIAVGEAPPAGQIKRFIESELEGS